MIRPMPFVATPLAAAKLGDDMIAAVGCWHMALPAWKHIVSIRLLSVGLLRTVSTAQDDLKIVQKAFDDSRPEPLLTYHSL